MLNRSLYVPQSSIGSTLPTDVGRFFACVGQDMTDDTGPERKNDWRLNLRKLEQRIIDQGFIRKRRDKVLVVDIERLEPLPVGEYVSVIELLKSMLPGWTIMPYLIPTYPNREAYWREIMERGGIDHVYMGVHRQNNTPDKIHHEVYAFLSWARLNFTSGDSTKVLAGVIPWIDSQFPNYRPAGSYLADICEIQRMGMNVAMWMFSKPRTARMDAYRNATLKTIRTCKGLISI